MTKSTIVQQPIAQSTDSPLAVRLMKALLPAAYQRCDASEESILFAIPDSR